MQGLRWKRRRKRRGRRRNSVIHLTRQRYTYTSHGPHRRLGEVGARATAVSSTASATTEYLRLASTTHHSVYELAPRPRKETVTRLLSTKQPVASQLRKNKCMKKRSEKQAPVNEGGRKSDGRSNHEGGEFSKNTYKTGWTATICIRAPQWHNAHGMWCACN